MIKPKPCPVCNSKNIKLVHYVSLCKSKDSQTHSDLTLKHVECASCGAYSVGLGVLVDNAIRDWNMVDNDGRRFCVVERFDEEELEVEE